MTAEQELFMDEVFEYLEYLGLPAYVVEYAAEDVGRSFSGAIEAGYECGLSAKLTALMIFGLTLDKVSRMTKVVH
jgi:hypothetical protein